QSQFDALTDFVFNLGQENFARSELLQRVNAADWNGAQEQIRLWVHAGGKVLPGLVTRRAWEAARLDPFFSVEGQNVEQPA
ncbi:MAG: lysozyme, partial [Candidatus Igneacidithiobacillus chanchocoensis]